MAVDEAVAAADHAAYVAERARANADAVHAKIERARQVVGELEEGLPQALLQAEDAQKAYDAARKKVPKDDLVSVHEGNVSATRAAAGAAEGKGE